MALVKAHRMYGHLAARLDPLGAEPIGDPALDPMRLEPKLTPELQARIPTSILRIHVDGESLREALPRLGETYCGSLGYEMEHIADHEQRVWLRKAIESWRFRTPLQPEEQRRLYARLCETEGMERATCAGRSSVRSSSRSRGSMFLIPMLDESIELAAASGVARSRARHGPPRAAQRLSHTRSASPTSRSCASSEGRAGTIEVVAADAEEGGTGDVKYHLGAEGVRATANGTDRGHARRESEPSRSRQPCRRGDDPRLPDRSHVK